MNIVCEELDVVKRDNPYSMILKDWIRDTAIAQKNNIVYYYNLAVSKNIDASEDFLSNLEYRVLFDDLVRHVICGYNGSVYLQVMEEREIVIRDCIEEITRGKNVICFTGDTYVRIVHSVDSFNSRKTFVNITGDKREFIEAMESLYREESFCDFEMMITGCGNSSWYRELEIYIEEYAFKLGHMRALKMKPFMYIKLGG